jgi:enoyl-CoA hydratase
VGLKFTSSDDVIDVTDDGVLKVTVNRAAKRNALSLGVLERLYDIFSARATDLSLRLVILTGAGEQAFASGGDLVELADVRLESDARELSLQGKRALNAIRTFPVPVIARLNGVALGGGAELAVACDLRFADAAANIGFIHSRLCIAPSWGGGVDLMRLVGYARGLSLLARGEILTPTAALSIGLVDGVCGPQQGFDEAFEAFILMMRRQPPQVMRAMKELSRGERLRDRAALEERETIQFVNVWTHQDHWAAADATVKRLRHK